ncbi:MAG: S49 family peptidase [Chloroflexota bacterium]
MRSNFLRYVVAVLFLVGCLVLGVWLGQRNVPKPVIGVLRFEGIIEFASAQYLIEVLDTARQDDRVAGVVLEILSPGGFATSSESVYYSMLQLRQEKPLNVYIDGYAASGGYYMAVASNQIFAPASANIGNVGARGMQPPDPSIAPLELSTGPYKLFGGSRFDRIHQLELVGEAFVTSVVNQRQRSAVNPLKLSQDELAEARLYVGSEAVALGLIDFEGAHTDAILSAAELAGVREYEVVNLPEFLNVPLPYGQPMVRSRGGSFEKEAQHLVATAPPDAIFLLDSRIPLGHYSDSPDVETHLLALRNVDRNPSYSSPQQSSNVSAPRFLNALSPQGE